MTVYCLVELLVDMKVATLVVSKVEMMGQLTVAGKVVMMDGNLAVLLAWRRVGWKVETMVVMMVVMMVEMMVVVMVEMKVDKRVHLKDGKKAGLKVEMLA